MNNKIAAFITENHMGLTDNLSELAFCLKTGKNAKVWPAGNFMYSYSKMAMEFSMRMDNRGVGGFVKPPTMEEMLVHRVARIGDSVMPKEARVFACCSLKHIGIMTSAETAIDAYNVTDCTLYIEEVDHIEDTSHVFSDYYCRNFKWKAGYFKAAYIPSLPDPMELDTLYELDYLGFLAKEDGIPGWMNFGNPLISGGFEPPPLLPGGGDGSGSNGQ